jgi:hypothetical protein
MKRYSVYAATAGLGTVLLLSSTAVPASSVASDDRTTVHVGPRPCDGTPNGDEPVYRWVTKKKKRNVITHAELRYVPAHASIDRKVTINKQRRTSSVLGGDARLYAKAGLWKWKAEVQVHVALAKFGRTTTSSKVKEQITIHPVGHRRRFAFFSGVKHFKLRWHYKNCNGRPYVFKDSGLLKSYSPRQGGAALCPHTRYKRGSFLRSATLAAGC